MKKMLLFSLMLILTLGLTSMDIPKPAMTDIYVKSEMIKYAAGEKIDSRIIVTVVFSSPCDGQGSNCYCNTQVTDDGCTDGVQVTTTNCYFYYDAGGGYTYVQWYSANTFALVPPC